ncbi:MAG TPA: site-2 protease family protein [Ktedonobacterales bacterium]|nr:site-2 protease family protein [Ktedonobacterales bacterium]
MFGPTIRIARLFGIPIRIDISWFVIFVIFVYAVTQDFFRPLFPQADPLVAAGLAVLTILLFFLSVLLHELAHSVVAMTNGMKVKGIALFVLGGVSQLEGEPRNPWVEFWMALAGPLASLLIGLLCGVLCVAFGGLALVRAYFHLDFLYSSVSAAAAVLFWLALQNLLLFLFNIIPGFPLDGGRMVRAFIWGVSRNYSLATRIAAWLSRGVGYLFLVLGAYLLITGNWTGVWLLLIGLFLLSAARVGMNQALIREMLQGYQVQQFVRPDTLVVPGQLSLELLIQEYYGRYNASLYPVRVGDQLLGVVTRALVQQALKKQRGSQRVSDVMAPLGPEYVIGPQAPAQEAFDRMAANSAGSLLVMEDDRLLGMVTQNEMLRMARLFPLLRRARSQPPPGPPAALPPPPLSPPSASSDPRDHYERFGP